MLIQWQEVPTADRYVVTRLFYGSKVLPKDTTAYTWADKLELFDLRGTFVHPEFVLVKAMSGDRTLATFTGTEPCPTMVFIAARGSGQNQFVSGAYGKGLGSRGERLWTRLVAGFGTSVANLPAIPVDYPAIAVGVGPGGVIQPGNNPTSYRHSVDAGIADAKSTVVRSLIACPDIDVIMFGYSQGSQVIGDAYTQLPPVARSHIVRVILFADPLYRSGDEAIRYLPAELDHHGIKGARPFMPSGGATVVESWCSDTDVICQLNVNSRDFHGPIYNEYEKLATANVLREVSLRPRSNPPTLPNLKDIIDKIREQGP